MTLSVHPKQTCYMKNKTIYLVTGSSGYVASILIPELKKKAIVFGIDIIASQNTDFISDIGSNELRKELKKFKNYNIFIINLAAARFDFGAKANDYYKKNVKPVDYFLESLASLNIIKFVHISSVAAIDGRDIKYSNNLSCDNAYRSTKFIQENIISKWCIKNNIPKFIVYPSAIFDNNSRSDTNIGKLQKISKKLPFIPYIKTKKSLTYLPYLTDFIYKILSGKVNTGLYLTIERPVLSVSEIIQIISQKNTSIVKLPCLKILLLTIAYFLYAIGGFGYFDLKLTPNRVVKLFKNTDYADTNDIDIVSYNKLYGGSLSDIINEIK